MNIYALLVALVLVTALLMQGYRRGNKKFVIVACLLLFSVYGLRNTFILGHDAPSSYLHLFQRMPSYSWKDVLRLGGSYNAGYYLLNKAFYELTNGDYQLFVSFIALFVTICFGRMIYRYSPNPLTSILYHFGLLLFTFHFSSLKQSIAMAFLMLAFDGIIDRAPIRFILLSLLASFFHFPSIVFLPSYWIAKMKPNRSFLILLAIVLLLTYRFRNQLLTWMLNLYKDEDISEVSMEGIRFLRTKALIMVIIIVAAIMFRKPKPEDRIYSILLEFMGIAVVFQTFCGYNNIFERLADYFFQFSVVFIPMVFDRNADREPLFDWRLMSVVDTAAPYLFCGFGIYRFISTITQDPAFYPYKFFFQS